jgi:hypothetical protein
MCYFTLCHSTPVYEKSLTKKLYIYVILLYVYILNVNTDMSYTECPVRAQKQHRL